MKASDTHQADECVRPSHIAHFYQDDASLVRTVADFIADGLHAGHAGILLATKPHRESAARQLTARGLDLPRLSREGRYLALDAECLLSDLMHEGMPDEEKFQNLIGGVIEKAGMRCPSVRVFGELASLLWGGGNMAAAVRLEQLWNQTRRRRPFSLWCGYSLNGIGKDTDGEHYQALCAEHSRIIPSEDYMRLPNEDRRLQFIADLQQRAAALSAESERRKEAELFLSRREQELKEALLESQILNEVAQTLGAELDLEKLLQKMTDAATMLTGAKFGAFFYNTVTEQGESQILYSLSGVPREAFIDLDMPRNAPLFEITFRGYGTVRIDDLLEDARYGRTPPHQALPLGHLPVRSYLAVPVISYASEVLGGLFFGHPNPRVFTERAERIAKGLAAQGGIALDNARLYQQARREIAVRKEAEERIADLLTNEQAARGEAERANRLKDEFLATVSHELKTPLNAIFGWAQLLLVEKAEDPKHALKAIERNARVQIKLTDDLLDLSRIISGKLHLNIRSIALTTAVDAAIEAIGPAAQAKRITIEKRGVSARPFMKIAGDPDRLQQVMWNLLSNAVKFTPPGGQITVNLSEEEDTVTVIVRDTGDGIDPAFLPFVFDRLRQADGSNTRKHAGLGLGLSIVRHIVEMHGGTVTAESRGLGEGASFIIALPTTLDPATQQALESATVLQAERKDRASISLEGVDVLLVDDDESALEIVCTILVHAGARVRTACSASQARSLLSQWRPDVILADIAMPEEDGYSFLQTLRACTPPDEEPIPAAAVTARAHAEDRIKALRAGYHNHIPKPIDQDELLAVVASLVR
jgi:signal transduction histidine kinase/ActR/RegA family two-component response regulator